MEGGSRGVVDMDVHFKHKGMWYADEVAAVVRQQFGFTPEVSTSGGEVIVHPRPWALTEEEGEWLQQYLDEHAQKSGEERMAEQEVAAETLRGRIQEVAGTTVGLRVDELTLLQMKALLVALLWNAGGIDSDLRVRSLSEWV